MTSFLIKIKQTSGYETQFQWKAESMEQIFAGVKAWRASIKSAYPIVNVKIIELPDLSELPK